MKHIKIDGFVEPTKDLSDVVKDIVNELNEDIDELKDNANDVLKYKIYASVEVLKRFGIKIEIE